jgi:hypothetical protein
MLTKKEKKTFNLKVKKEILIHTLNQAPISFYFLYGNFDYTKNYTLKELLKAHNIGTFFLPKKVIKYCFNVQQNNIFLNGIKDQVFVLYFNETSSVNKKLLDFLLKISKIKLLFFLYKQKVYRPENAKFLISNKNDFLINIQKNLFKNFFILLFILQTKISLFKKDINN